MTTQTINLNLIPHGIMPVAYASQFDEQTNALIFKLYNDTTPYTIPSGTSILCNGTKPDGTGFSYSAASYSGNTVNVNVYKQMAAVAGDVLCELRLTKSAQTVGSLNFILRVEQTALEDGVISETVLPLIERAAEIAAEIDGYMETVATEAAAAQGYANAAQLSAADAAIAASNVDAQYSALEDLKTDTTAAKVAAQDAADAISNIAATASTLPAGSSAIATYDSTTHVFSFGIPTGATGASGVTTPLTGFFTMWVDPDTGNLYAASETDMSDCFSYDSDTGNLYFITEDGN